MTETVKNSSINEEIEKNHLLLKNMIDMIDNRPSTRFTTDRLSISSTARPTRTNRLMEESKK